MKILMNKIVKRIFMNNIISIRNKIKIRFHKMILTIKMKCLKMMGPVKMIMIKSKKVIFKMRKYKNKQK